MADYDDDQDPTDLVPRAHIRQLEEKAKKATELEERLADMERRAAFSEALGTAATDPRAKYFIKGYEGEMTAEAIRAEALEAGVLSKPPEEGQPQKQTEDLSGHARMAANAAGGASAGKPSWQEALAEADRIPDQAEREAAILTVVESFGGVTSRTAQ